MTEYLDLVDYMLIAEAVTGIEAAVLDKAARLELAESALGAPQASFGEVEFYPEFVTKAAVLCARLAWNHPLPDGNKALLGWPYESSALATAITSPRGLSTTPFPPSKPSPATKSTKRTSRRGSRPGSIRRRRARHRCRPQPVSAGQWL